MHTLNVNDKAMQLLAKREEGVSTAMYLRQNAIRHLIYAAIYWLMIVLAWSAGLHAVSFLVAGFWAGRLSRDIQWYRRLVAEWNTTRELLDWEKIESLASGATTSS
jgi:hypothetical protein